MTTGYIYVLTNKAMPGMVKIGRTGRDPAARARELRTTGVPVHFELIHSTLVENSEETERHIHQILSRQGVRSLSDREFFEISPDDAIELIHMVVGTLSEGEPDFSRSQELEKLTYALPLPLGVEEVSEDAADRLTERLIEIGRRGYPNALKVCAEINLYNRPSAAHFRECWQEYLTLAQSEAKWKRLNGSNGRGTLQQLGRDVAEYLEHMHRNRWLMSVDFDFVSQYLVSGERFAYEGYTEGLKRTSLPPHIRAQAEEL